MRHPGTTGARIANDATRALAPTLQGEPAMHHTWWLAIAGGAAIGAAATLLFLTHGRTAGVSGVIGALLPPTPSDRAWRVAFLVGLLLAGAVASVVAPTAIGAPVRSSSMILIAGVLVGFGTRMGGGCTSGHGVCGLARRSARSLVAVLTFMATGGLTAWLAGGGA